MAISVPTMQDLLGAGVHFGHQVRRGHPKMKPFIYGARDGVHIIDLAKSEEKLKEAVEFAHNLGKEGKVLLVVGTKKQAREIVESLAKEVETPFIVSRWVGGLLTNFDEIKKNINRLNDLKDEKAKGTLSRYTKKEQLLIDRDLIKFDRDFGGVAKMDKVPDAMFIVDAVSDKVAVKEARSKGLVIVGFADTNSDPNNLDYPIPANDDGIKSIKLISEAVIRAYGEGQKEGGELRIKNEELRVKEEKKTAEKKEKEDKKIVAKKEKEDTIGAAKTALDSAKLTEEPRVLDDAVAEEAAAIEEVVEKKAIEDSERKV